MPSDRSILFVGEDRDFCENLAAEIRRAGFDVRLARDGQRSLLLLRRRKVDLVVLGRRIADINEMAFLATVRWMYPDLPVIYLTGDGRREASLGAGGGEYPVSTADPERILGLIHSLCS
jgi:DNA-binding NtrC family response regulator